MASFIERIRNYLPQKEAIPPPTKNAVIHSGNIDGWLWQGLASNQDLPNTKYGYALAYLLVPDVRVCVDIYALNIGRLLSLIIQNSTFDPANDETIARSDDVMVRHPYYQSTLWHRRLEKTPYMMKLAYSYILFDEMYVIQQDNEFGQKSGLQVLNPLAMQPVIENGVIRGYTYSQFQGTRIEIDIEDLAFDHGYNPLDDFRGSSVVMTVIDSINPLRNLVNYINEFFINNARQGMSASFKNSEDNNPQNYENIKQAIKDHLKGKGNQFKTFLSMVPLEWQAFENPDIGKQFSIDDPLTKKIYRAFGVPMSLAGDTSGTNYKESKDNLASFINVQALPHIENIQDFQTDSVLPFFVEKDSKGNIDQRFEFDTSRFDVLTQEDKLQSEVVGADLNIGLMTVAEAQESRGITRDEDFEDRYMVDGLPVPKEDYLNLYKVRFAIADEATSTDDSNGGDEADEDETPPTDDDNGSAGEENLGEEVINDKGVAVPQSQVFGYHIEAGIVKIDEARAQLNLPPIGEQESDELQALQAQLSVMVTASQAGLSTGEAAAMVGLEIPAVSEDSEVDATDIEDGQEAQAEKHLHGVKVFEPPQATPEAELSAWRTCALKKWKRGITFDVHWLRGDIADELLETILTCQGSRDVIDAAFKVVAEQIAIKAIQATRLDFEARFEAVLQEIRDGNLDRRRAGILLRSMVRMFGNRAFRDGLIDGGVTDGEPDDEDLITIAELIRDASPFISDLTDDLINGDGISDAQAAQRTLMWWNKTIKPFYNEGLVSASKNAMHEFAGDDGEESCETCKRLKGQRHRLKDWIRKALQPGIDTDNFDCNGFQCHHELVRVFGKARGRW